MKQIFDNNQNYHRKFNFREAIRNKIYLENLQHSTKKRNKFNNKRIIDQIKDKAMGLIA